MSRRSYKKQIFNQIRQTCNFMAINMQIIAFTCENCASFVGLCEEFLDDLIKYVRWFSGIFAGMKFK